MHATELNPTQDRSGSIKKLVSKLHGLSDGNFQALRGEKR